MKTNMRFASAAFLVLSFLAGCQKEESSVIPQLDQEIAKIETTLQKGYVKLETAEGVRIVEESQVQAQMDEAFRKQNARTENVTATASLYDVGVIAASGFWSDQCPYSYGSRAVSIYMDAEDSRPETNRTGWANSITVDGYKNATFSFCVVDGRQFQSLRNARYAVLQLSTWMPAGAHRVRREHDTQDRTNQYNQNNWVGDISSSPIVVTDRIIGLEFISFDANPASTATGLPNLGSMYGVFSGYGYYSNSPNHSLIHVDDEDSNNINKCYWGSGSIVKTGDVDGFINADHNTDYKMAKYNVLN